MDLAQARLVQALQRQDSEKSAKLQVGQIAGAPVANADGIVSDWGTPDGWEAFKAAAGFYPYGMQNGTMIRPANASQAPPWAARLMGGHVPPGF